MAKPSISARRRALLGGTQSGRDALRRVKVLGALAVVTLVGTVGYVVLGFTRWRRCTRP